MLDKAQKEKSNYEDYKKGLKVYIAGLSAYGVLITSLSAIFSKNFLNDFKLFWTFVWEKVVCGFFSLADTVSNFLTDLMDKIPQPIIAFIFHWLVFIIFWVGVVKFVFYLWGKTKDGFDFMKRNFTNTLTLTIFLYSLAIIVFLGDLIKGVVPINLFLLLMLINAISLIYRYFTDSTIYY